MGPKSAVMKAKSKKIARPVTVWMDRSAPRTPSYASMRASVRAQGAKFYANNQAYEEGKKSKYTGLWCRVTEWTTRWSCCLWEPGRGGPDHSWSPDDDPLLLLQCNSEVEAALTHDLGALWLKLNATGGATEEQLKRMRWNLPQLQLWQDGAVKSLSGIPLEDKGRARTTIRRLAQRLLRQLPAGMLPPAQAKKIAKDDKAKAVKKERQRKAAAKMREADKKRFAKVAFLVHQASLTPRKTQKQEAAERRAAEERAKAAKKRAAEREAVARIKKVRAVAEAERAHERLKRERDARVKQRATKRART